jgi:hypothetical protein
MSGVEFIVGTVLTSVPIALEIFDRSGRVFEVFAAFKKYPKEVRILETKLGNQKAIFRNNSLKLLTSITADRVAVQKIMNDPSSLLDRTGLRMAPFFSRRIDTLGESFKACRATADRICDALRILRSMLESIRPELDNKLDASPRV